MRRPFVRAAIVAFISSFCTLVIELVAGRILAPWVGVSLYTWTSIIGVVLAGISLGAYAGGWLADRRPVPSTLGLLLLASGLTALGIAPAADALGEGAVLTSYGIAGSLPQRVVLLSVLLFFLPSFFLGMISPVAVKLAVADLESAGRVVGRIYAFSTLGSIAGTFTTGFYLVAEFGTRKTMLGVGVVLILSALVFGDLLGRIGRVVAALFIVVFSLLAFFGTRSFEPPPQRRHPSAEDEAVIHTEESQYYTIKVRQTPSDDGNRLLQSLELDHLVHSYTDLQDPTYLAYSYLEVFNEVIRWKIAKNDLARLLFIGGGGYTLPRLTELMSPGAEIDVVEIDPAVTRTAYRYFGLDRHTAIRTRNEDARWFLMRGGDLYDLVFIDAFNDLSVPYHLTTREFTSQLRKRLAPDGALVANVIDNFVSGRFLASYVKTLQSVFGERNVTLMYETEDSLGDVQSTFVVIASPSLDALLSSIQKERAFSHRPVPAEAPLSQTSLQRYLQQRQAIVLTDDYVPVDNMLAPLFADRFAHETSASE